MQNQPANGGPNYLEDWIEYRGMAKGEVAAKAGISASMMSELISGKKKLTALYLRKLSKVLDCHPGDIIEFHPHDVPPEIRDRFLRATKEQLKQIAQLMDVVMPYDPGPPAQNGNR